MKEQAVSSDAPETMSSEAGGAKLDFPGPKDRGAAFELLVSSVRDYAIFLLDRTGHVATWNVGAQRIKGYQASEIIGKHFSNFYPPEVIAEGKPAYELKMAIAEGRFEDEGWRLRKDGSMFWANVIITALFDEQGQHCGFSKVTRDMTERRNTEESIRSLNSELKRSVDRLAETNRDLARKSAENEMFVYSVSHDIRAPLVNLQGFSQELRLASKELRDVLAEGDLAPAVRERIGKVMVQGVDEPVRYIATATEHLSRIVDGLLRLSRTGQVVYRLAEVELDPILERLVVSLKLMIDQSGAKFDLKKLPRVWGDDIALEQLFGNLISNAIKYLDPARPGRVEIGALDDTTNGHTIYVRDNGLGFPEAGLANLFRVFHRFHPDAPAGEGMGLAIVHRIVERHGGQIRVTSKLGEGTTFYVTLPHPKQPDE